MNIEQISKNIPVHNPPEITSEKKDENTYEQIPYVKLPSKAHGKAIADNKVISLIIFSFIPVLLVIILALRKAVIVIFIPIPHTSDNIPIN